MKTPTRFSTLCTKGSKEIHDVEYKEWDLIHSIVKSLNVLMEDGEDFMFDSKIDSGYSYAIYGLAKVMTNNGPMIMAYSYRNSDKSREHMKLSTKFLESPASLYVAYQKYIEGEGISTIKHLNSNVEVVC